MPDHPAQNPRSRPLEWASAYALEQLFPSQYEAARRVLLGIHEIAIAEAEHRKGFSSTDEYEWEQWGRRPQNVFFLDGARGAGKTFVLMSILNIARQLGRGGVIAARADMGLFRERLVGQAIESLRKLEQTENSDNPGKTVSLFEMSRYRRTAIVLPTLFPVDNDGAGSCMEVLFASLGFRLREELKKDGAQKEKIRELQASLVDMTRRWSFSQNLGLEAILSDSSDYTDFVRKRAEQSAESNLRIDEWRKFINRFCDFFNAGVLVLGIDDTDVKPALTIDILHSLRIYLDHPRIATVLAGNLRAMRQSLVYSKFSELRSSTQTIQDNFDTLRDWRRFEREEIEQYLEKVLPRWRRNFVGPSNPRSVQIVFDKEWDMLFSASFDRVSFHMLDCYRDDYTIGKTLAALQYHEQIHDRLATESEMNDAKDGIRRWNAEARGKVEQFISWWLFRHYYAERLQPTTVRQILSLKHYVKRFLPSDLGGEWRPGIPTPGAKRLSVILFESADNYLVSQRFDDNDKVITEWLSKQKVKASWGEQRWIKINGRRIPEGSYSYEAICFRIDLIFARPLRFHEDSSIPREMLPKPAGIRDIAPFHAPREIGDAPHFGVGSYLKHAAIPRNCIFISDLRALPLACFEGPWVAVAPVQEFPEPSWESRIAQDLPGLFGNDPRGKIMAYLNGWVAPILQRTLVRHGQQSWLRIQDDLLLKDEMEILRMSADKLRFTALRPDELDTNDHRQREPEVMSETSGRNSGDQKFTPNWYDSIVKRRNNKKYKRLKAFDDYLVRYLSLFTAIRYAWSATVVFISGLERSMNHGLSSSVEPIGAGLSKELIVRGTLSQEIARDHFLFLDFNWLLEAIKMVPWLRDRILPEPPIGSDKELESEESESAEEKLERLGKLLVVLGMRPGSDSKWKHSYRKLGKEQFDEVALFYGYARLIDPKISVVDKARMARVLRHFLLYLIGLHASIPALIHVEIASSMGVGQVDAETEIWKARNSDPQAAELWKKRIEDARRTCSRWTEFVENAFLLITRMEIDAAIGLRDAVKLSRPELFCGMDAKWSAAFSYEAWKHVAGCSKYGFSGERAGFTIAPDISVSTLFGERVENDSHIAKPLPGYPEDIVAFRGLFEQARTNLWLGARYLDDVRKEIDRWEIGP